MTNSGIASRYALALVDAVTASGSGMDPAQALDELRAFGAATVEVRDLYLALVSPAVTPQRKRDILSALADLAGTSQLVRNFLLVVNDHRRMNIFQEIIEGFSSALDRRLGVVEADVTTAAALSSEEVEELASKLGSLTGRAVRMKIAIDPELIGGLVARVDGSVYDGSVRGQLLAIGQRLTAEQ